MNFPRYLLLFLVFASVSSGQEADPAPAQETGAQERPLNIVLIVVDDMSPDLGVYGNSSIRTPELDALAAGGTLFTHAFATTASCSASRSVILTGQHNHANGHYGHQHDFHGFESWIRMRGLPVLLKECGYETVQIGKLHVAPHEVYRFDTYLKAPGRNPVKMAENCRPFLTDAAAAAAGNPAEANPFFLYFATQDPHRSGVTAPPGSEDSLPPDLFGNLPGRAAHEGVTEVFYRPEDVTVPAFLPDTPETRAELAQYYQSISRIDQGVGRLFSILRETGLWDSTVVIFTSDHGMAFAGAKTNVYEPALHVPFIVRHPTLSLPGSREGAPISFVDITPTLLDIAGGYNRAENSPVRPDSRKLPPPSPGENRGPRGTDPDKFHGRSFLPLLSGETDLEVFREDKLTYASHTFHEIQMYYPMRAVWDQKYKLIWNVAHQLPFPFASDLWAASSWQAQWKKGPGAGYGTKTVREYIHRPEFELFSVADDPDETTNLAYDPAFADILSKYTELLHRFQDATADGWRSKQEFE